MKELKVKCPAKINLTLEIVNKRIDGFHNIKSIMQLINLYDYLTTNNLTIKGYNNTDDLLRNISLSYFCF